jgi:alkyl hydroperoxide reductase subunit D
MENVKNLITSLPDAAKDLKLNLQSVLGDGASSLSEKQRFGIALACSYSARNEGLKSAVLTDAEKILDEGWIDDAKAAAALMSMNNVYYRFRHMIGKPEYAVMPARLRMSRIAQPQSSKLDFEFMCLAVSAINACEMCVRSHEKSLLELGATEVQVHDAVRIAAVVFAAAVSLELEPAAAGDL